MKRYLSWSGGKDSSASIIVCHEHGILLDGIIFCEVMFDNSRNISGENPKHIKWIYDTAIPIIERMGYKVNVLRANNDYVRLFNRRVGSRSKWHGLKYGYVIPGRCTANDRLKIKPIKDFRRSVGEHEEIIGIAADEPQRLARLKPNCRSVLAEYSIAEKDTYALCRKYGLLSPIYETRSRGGCWFCPNCSIKEFAAFKKEYPELWAELETLSHDKEIVSQGFKYGRTFDSVNQEIDVINNQISVFDILGSSNEDRAI